MADGIRAAEVAAAKPAPCEVCGALRPVARLKNVHPVWVCADRPACARLLRQQQVLKAQRRQK